VEVSFDGKPAANFHGLLTACCTLPTDTCCRRPICILPATCAAACCSGEIRAAIFLAEKSDDPRWPRLEALMTKIDIRVCYCSVFEECYLHDSRRTEPASIEACPVSGTPYVDE